MHNILFKLTMPAAVYHKVIMFLETLVDFVFWKYLCHSTLKRCSVEKVGYAINRFPRSEEGCITQNKISLMTIVAYRYSKVTEAFQTTGPVYLRAVWYLPFINSPILSHIILVIYRKFTVTTVGFTQNVSCSFYNHHRY